MSTPDSHNELLSPHPTPKPPDRNPVPQRTHEGPRVAQTITNHITQGDSPHVIWERLGAEAPNPPKTPFELAVENDKTRIVGGEIIGHAALRTTDPRGAEGLRVTANRGWLEAMTKARFNQEHSMPDRQKNVQEIVDAAKNAGVPREAIIKHLTWLGLHPVDAAEPTRNTDITPPSPENPEIPAKTGVAKILEVPQDTAQHMVDRFIAGGSNYEKFGQESLVGFVKDDQGIEYVIKEYMEDDPRKLKLKHESLQKIMDKFDQNGYGNYAPITFFERNGMIYQVQRRVSPFSTTEYVQTIQRELAQMGLLLRDPKSNIAQWVDNKGHGSPILFDYGNVGALNPQIP